MHKKEEVVELKDINLEKVEKPIADK